MEAGKPTSYVFKNNKDQFEVCVKSDRYLSSLGVWVGDNPFNFAIPITLCQIVMIIIITRSLCYVLKPIKTPKFTCCVLGGILLGPSCLGHNYKFMSTLFPVMQTPVLVTLSRMGVVYFVFIIALKMDVLTTLRASKRCWRFAVIPAFLSVIVTSFLLFLYRPHGIDRGLVHGLPNFLGLSSFAVISEALLELNLFTTELGQIALSTSMACEFIQWTFFLLSFSFNKNIVFTVSFITSCSSFLLFCTFVVRPTMKEIIRRTPMGNPVKEAYIVLILLGVLVVSAISDAIGISYYVGPLIYGLVIPNGRPLATTIIEKSEFVISEFFMPFFFGHLGLLTDFTRIENWRMVIIFQCILFVGFLTKVLACIAIAPSYNIRTRHGMVLGLILSIKGILELIVFTRMKKGKLISDQIFSQLVLYIVLITAICAPLINWLYENRPRVSKLSSINEGHWRRIQSASLTSQFNIITCMHHDGNVHGTIALLEACNPSQESPIHVHVIHLVELLGKSTPILFPMNTRNGKSLSVNYPNTNHIMRAFQNYSRNSNGPVTVLPYANVAPHNNMHEAICKLAEEKLVPFLVISFHDNDQVNNKEVSASIRELNTSFQAHARCTVGILVDKYSRLGLSSSKFDFHVAIFFIGGADDREALALGIRMLGRVNTRVTLLWFVVKNKGDSLGVGVDQTVAKEQEEEWKEEEEEKEQEGILDDSLIDEFKSKKLNSDNAVCHEIVVEDSMVSVLKAIQKMEVETYDLVMVGKRHCIGGVTGEEMTTFMDNADQLGVVGDMLASAEFCDGKISLLVMRCGEERVQVL